jgi:hypothetical protein
MKKEIRQVLEAPFPPEVLKQREGSYGRMHKLIVLKVPDYTRMFGFNGDRMTPGIAVSTSEVGILAFSIEAYFTGWSAPTGSSPRPRWPLTSGTSR